MLEKFLNSCYKLHELLIAKIKALSLDRATILGLDEELKDSQVGISSNKSNNLNFVINQNPQVRKSLTAILNNRQDDINRLLGDTRVIISEKNHPSTEQLLFAKSSFSKTIKLHNKSQKCGAKRCKCCNIIGIDRTLINKISTIDNQPIKQDASLDCKSTNIIYLFICNHCSHKSKITDFYFGRTFDKAHERTNGHRTYFNLDNFSYKNRLWLCISWNIIPRILVINVKILV